ncbi:hypothetical protein D3C78_1544430 [compost metagenome]
MSFLGGVDVDGMQALGSLDDLEDHRLACLQGLVALHRDGGVVGKQVVRFAFFIDKTVTLGIVEPFHLADCHAHIPLQQTPSLEYHPVNPRQILHNWIRRQGPFLPTVGSIGCNTVLPIVKASRYSELKSSSTAPTTVFSSTDEPFFPCMQSARFD